MFEVIQSAYPRVIEALRRHGLNRADAAGLILSARFGNRAAAWSATDCERARALIRAAFAARRRRLRIVH